MKTLKTLRWLVVVAVMTLSFVSANGATVTVTGAGINQNIPIDVPLQFIGAFTITATQEVSPTFIGFTVNSTRKIEDIYLFNQNGLAVAGTSGTTSFETNSVFWFISQPVFPVGTNTYTIRGRLSQSFTNGESIIVSTRPSTDWQKSGVEFFPTNYIASAVVTARIAPQITSISISNMAAAILWATNTVPDFSYQAEDSTDLVHWQSVGTSLIATSSVAVIEIPINPAESQKFFRLVSLPQ